MLTINKKCYKYNIMQKTFTCCVVSECSSKLYASLGSGIGQQQLLTRTPHVPAGRSLAQNSYHWMNHVTKEDKQCTEFLRLHKHAKYKLHWNSQHPLHTFTIISVVMTLYEFIILCCVCVLSALSEADTTFLNMNLFAGNRMRERLINIESYIALKCIMIGICCALYLLTYCHHCQLILMWCSSIFIPVLPGCNIYSLHLICVS